MEPTTLCLYPFHHTLKLLITHKRFLLESTTSKRTQLKQTNVLLYACLSNPTLITGLKLVRHRTHHLLYGKQPLPLNTIVTPFGKAGKLNNFP